MDLSFLNGIVSDQVLVWLQIILAMIGAGAVASAHLPRKDSNKWYWKLLDFLAQNINHAKNKK